MQKIYHKRNELLEVEFYKDEKCTILFDFTNAKDLYIELKDVGILFQLSQKFNRFLDNANDVSCLYTPYLPNDALDGITALQKTSYGTKALPKIYTLDDITPNLSKYIPEDNAVLFLSEEDKEMYCNNLENNICLFSLKDLENWNFKYLNNSGEMETPQKTTIFPSYGTQATLQKANKVAKELKEKYGIKEVSVFVLLCFVSNIYEYNSSFTDDFFKQDFQDAYDELCSMGCKPNMPKQKYKMQFEKEKLNHKQECYINKIITTNSTGILEPQDSEKLQVIDCFDIFNDAL